ncbi:MAG: site-2 protease family protein, partial [Myxococcaceae bacterium]
MAEAAADGTTRCLGCGSHLAPQLLACPRCHRLAHGEELKTLAARAEAASAANDPASALAAWRTALDLLPPGSQQHAAVASKIEVLSKGVDAGPAESRGRMPKVLGALGAAGLLLWKLKFVLVFVLTKAKFLLFGLSKGGTVVTMALALGAYWALWGWKFAAGFIGCIYVHEMGHVWALRRLGIAASAPMFIPGFGALVRMKQRPADVREDARVGLAGPIWGLGATIVAWGLSQLFESPFFAAIAHVNAFITLFNLLPIWTLDGGRGFRALTRMQRAWVIGAIGMAFFASSESLYLLLGLVGVMRLFGNDAPARGDRRAFIEFLVLVGANAYF